MGLFSELGGTSPPDLRQDLQRTLDPQVINEVSCQSVCSL